MTIEAVNSVLSNAPYTRAAVQQQSVAASYAANPARVQEANLQAPYISLYIKVDTNFDKAVLQIRDTDTGDVVRQIPTESQLEAYRRAQSSNAVKPAEPRETADIIVINEPETPEPAPQEVKRAAPPVVASVPEPAPAPEAPAKAPAPAPVSVDTQA